MFKMACNQNTLYNLALCYTIFTILHAASIFLHDAILSLYNLAWCYTIFTILHDVTIFTILHDVILSLFILLYNHTQRRKNIDRIPRPFVFVGFGSNPTPPQSSVS